jgi:hypothetical protein
MTVERLPTTLLYTLPLVHLSALLAVGIVGHFRKDRRLLYVLPLVHFSICMLTQFADWEWMPVFVSELPVGAVLLGITWRFGHPLFWCGVVGSLWFYIVSRVILVEFLWKRQPSTSDQL